MYVCVYVYVKEMMLFSSDSDVRFDDELAGVCVCMYACMYI